MTVASKCIHFLSTLIKTKAAHSLCYDALRHIDHLYGFIFANECIGIVNSNPEKNLQKCEPEEKL